MIDEQTRHIVAAILTAGFMARDKPYRLSLTFEEAKMADEKDLQRLSGLDSEGVKSEMDLAVSFYRGIHKILGQQQS